MNEFEVIFFIIIEHKYHKNFYKSNNALNDIFEFVEKKYDDKGFIKGLRYMKNLLNRTDDNFMKTTMRMTIF